MVQNLKAQHALKLKLLTEYKIKLQKEIYKITPANSLREFLCDPKYLGNSTDNGEGIYPGWWKYIDKFMQDDNRYLITLTGSIGSGKTSIATYVLAYIVHLLLCMKDPWRYFGINGSSPMAVAFFCLTFDEDEGTKAYRTLQGCMLNSPWFINYQGAIISGTKNKRINFPGKLRWIFSTPEREGFGIQGEDVVAGILDEVDNPKQSMEKKKKVLLAFNSMLMRFSSRFAKPGFSKSRLFIVSSKQDDLGFLEEFIDSMRNDPRSFIVDEPQWNILSQDNYSGKKFSVMVGDAYTLSKILSTKEEGEEARRDGFKVLHVPVELRQDFEKDIVQALRDRAGVTVAGSRKHKLFTSSKDIKFVEDKDDPVSVSTILTSLDDDSQWVKCIDLSKLRTTLDVPRFLHYDMSITEDSSGLACSHIAGWTLVDKEQEDGTFAAIPLPVVETDFIVRIKAKKKSRIPLNKMRQMVFDLKRRGLNIKLFSADLRLLSEDTLQILNRNGVNAEYFSVDRNVQSNIDFRNLVQENRWLCHRHEWFFIEAKNVEWDREKGKIDHPDKIKVLLDIGQGQTKELVVDGSKDIFDAVVGSTYHCMKNAKQYVNVSEVRKALQACAGTNKFITMPDDWFFSHKHNAIPMETKEDHLDQKKNFLKDSALMIKSRQRNLMNQRQRFNKKSMLDF